MKAKIHITLKNGVLDPQGKAIENALDHLGFSGVEAARVGKYIELDLTGIPADKAQASAEQMCEKLLANTVVENYRITIE
ncbi:MAG: phosphoribosylformylglycinamidine synthase [Alphaproteobacteria bacterium]|nr:phosphoribosylformylglycinamidine synthase [Alphaproteobacteria bacterium]